MILVVLWQGRAAVAEEPSLALAAMPGFGVLVSPEAGQVLALDVSINQAALGTWPVLELNGAHYVTGDTLTAWRVHVPTGARPVMHRERLWWPLFAIPGYRANLDYRQQSLAIEVAPAAFSPTQIAPPPTALPSVSPVVPSLFLNYDLAWTSFRGRENVRSDDVGALTEVGASVARGVLLSTQLQRASRIGGEPSISTFTRLETTWIRDFPDRSTSLRLGDGWTAPSMWGRNVAFGGLQVGTNTILTPSLSSHALPVITGSAAAPSTVELYVNEVLRQTLNVPPGPFTLETLGQMAGAGEARVVVRDPLGRESILVQPYFTHASLLSPGIAQWSVETGQLRRGLGVESSDYALTFAQGLVRRGMTNALTLEGRAQAGQGIVTAGVGGSLSVANRVLAQLAVAGSSASGRGRGTSVLVGAASQGLRDSVGFRVLASSRGYRELGLAETEQPNRLEASATMRLGIGATDALGLNLAVIRRQSGYAESVSTPIPVGFITGDQKAASLSYTQRIGARGTLVWSATRVTGSTSGTNLQLMLVLPLDGRTVSTSTLSRVNGQLEGYTSATTPVGSENGWGWRAVAGHRSEQSYAEGGVARQTDGWLVSLDASAGTRTSVLRGNAQGSLVVIDGRAFGSRRLQDGFALVEVKGHPDVGVGLVGPTLTRTDGEGLALLPNLAAYQVSRIRLDPNDLPPSAELDTIEMPVVPPWRGGVKIAFPVRSGRSALLRFHVAGDQVAPLGAVVTLAGDDREFMVGRRGESYVTGLSESATVTLSWRGQRCDVAIALPPPSEDVTRVGPLQCVAIQP